MKDSALTLCKKQITRKAESDENYQKLKKLGI